MARQAVSDDFIKCWMIMDDDIYKLLLYIAHWLYGMLY